AVQFLTDAFGYDSGGRVFNVGDHISFRFGGNDPNVVARTPDDGMDAIPKALAARFERGGGTIRFRSQVQMIEVDADGDVQRLRLEGGTTVETSRTVITAPIPALRQLASTSTILRTSAFARVLDSVEGFAAMKLYLWYDRPWWRPAISGIRTTTDLPVKKVFYVDTGPDEPAALLAMYTDSAHVQDWVALAGSASGGEPAPGPMLAEVRRELQALHPEVGEVPEPAGSTLMHWGADPMEIGWTFWRAGHVSDEIIASVPQPDPAVAIHLAGETFSHAQSWVEGALESAEPVIRLLTRA
ncbi:MAG: FAD-dependent oxidoreductase, partial [Candidatus Limnocylindrales bacterium]